MARKNTATRERKPRTSLSKVATQVALSKLQAGLDEATFQKVLVILNPAVIDPVQHWLFSLPGDVREGGMRQIAWNIIQPFMMHAESGVFALAAPAELQRRKILSIVNAALGKRFTKVEFISASQMVQRPSWEWVDHFVYRAMLKLAVKEAAGVHVDGELEKSYGQLFLGVEDALRVGTESLLRQKGKLRNGIQQGIAALFRESLSAYSAEKEIFLGKGVGTGGIAWNIVRVALMYHLAFTVSGEGQSTAKLGPFVELLPRCIPFASKGGSPTTLLVLCG